MKQYVCVETFVEISDKSGKKWSIRNLSSWERRIESRADDVEGG